MAFSPTEIAGIKQPALGTKLISPKLDGTTTSHIFKVGNPGAKVSLQSTDTLVGNVLFSINGLDYFDSTAFTATTPVSYSTHSVFYIRVDRTNGAGKMHIVVS